MKTCYAIIFSILLLVLLVGCSRQPQSDQPPTLPSFDEFAVDFPESITNTNEGAELAELHIDLENTIFGMINSIETFADGPYRIGLTWVWTAEVNEASYTITAGLLSNGYDWKITINGTNEFGYYDNIDGIIGYSNFMQERFTFDLYNPASPEAGPAANVEYSRVNGSKKSLAEVYGYYLPIFGGISLHFKIDVEENSNGTGHIISYWDENHIWPASSRYLELHWWDDHGSWETWDQAELSISSSSGAW